MGEGEGHFSWGRGMPCGGGVGVEGCPVEGVCREAGRGHGGGEGSGAGRGISYGRGVEVRGLSRGGGWEAAGMSLWFLG